MGVKEGGFVEEWPFSRCCCSLAIVVAGHLVVWYWPFAIWLVAPVGVLEDFVFTAFCAVTKCHATF